MSGLSVKNGMPGRGKAQLRVPMLSLDVGVIANGPRSRTAWLVPSMHYASTRTAEQTATTRIHSALHHRDAPVPLLHNRAHARTHARSLPRRLTGNVPSKVGRESRGKSKASCFGCRPGKEREREREDAHPRRAPQSRRRRRRLPACRRRRRCCQVGVGTQPTASCDVTASPAAAACTRAAYSRRERALVCSFINNAHALPCLFLFK